MPISSFRRKPQRSSLDVLRALRGNQEEGFTLIELLVVIIIIGILAAIAFLVFGNQQEEAVKAGVKSDVRNTVSEVAIALVADPTNPELTSSSITEEGPVDTVVSSGNNVLVRGGWDSYEVYGWNDSIDNWVYAHYSNPAHPDSAPYSGGQTWVELEEVPSEGASSGLGSFAGICDAWPEFDATVEAYIEATYSPESLQWTYLNYKVTNLDEEGQYGSEAYQEAYDAFQAYAAASSANPSPSDLALEAALAAMDASAAPPQATLPIPNSLYLELAMIMSGEDIFANPYDDLGIIWPATAAPRDPATLTAAEIDSVKQKVRDSFAIGCDNMKDFDPAILGM